MFYNPFAFWIMKQLFRSDRWNWWQGKSVGRTIACSHTLCYNSNIYCMLITVLVIGLFAYSCNQLFSKVMNMQNTSHSIVVCVVEICGLCYRFSWTKTNVISRIVAWVLQKDQGVTVSLRAETNQLVGRIFTLSQEHGFLS